MTLEKDPGEAFRFDGGTNTYGYDYQSAHVALLDAGRIDALGAGRLLRPSSGRGWRCGGRRASARGPTRSAGRSGAGAASGPTGRSTRTTSSAARALTVGVAAGRLRVGVRQPPRARRERVHARHHRPRRPRPPAGRLRRRRDEPQRDGLHRTDRELARKDALDETLVGGGAEYRIANGSGRGAGGRRRHPVDASARPLGAGHAARRSCSTSRATRRPSSAPTPTPRRGPGWPSARSRAGAGGGLGAVGGVGVDLGGGADLLVVGRSYAPDFVSLHGYPFGERNGIGQQRERALRRRVRIKPSRSWTINAYLDQYRFPFLRFNVPRPSRGREALLHVEHRPSRSRAPTLQARTETREVGARRARRGSGLGRGRAGRADAPDAPPPGRVGRQPPACACGRASRAPASSASRTEVSVTTGSLVYQDVRWQPLRWLRADARLTLFDTDGYDARLYAFENDLTGVFAIPALSGRGARGYVLLAARPVDGRDGPAQAGDDVAPPGEPHRVGRERGRRPAGERRWASSSACGSERSDTHPRPALAARDGSRTPRGDRGGRGRAEADELVASPGARPPPRPHVASESRPPDLALTGHGRTPTPAEARTIAERPRPPAVAGRHAPADPGLRPALPHAPRDRHRADAGRRRRSGWSSRSGLQRPARLCLPGHRRDVAEPARPRAAGPVRVAGRARLRRLLPHGVDRRARRDRPADDALRATSTGWASASSRTSGRARSRAGSRTTSPRSSRPRRATWATRSGWR